jgi:NDP-sugar pyrophosphorylase family protein
MHKGFQYNKKGNRGSISYGELIKYHMNNKYDATIATFSKEVKIDLGVIQTENGELTNYIEKPTYHYDVSMGIYIFNKNIIDLIPKNTKMDMPELIMKIKQSGGKIGCYQEDCFWLDIGRCTDYEEAVRIYKENRGEFLPNE